MRERTENFPGQIWRTSQHLTMVLRGSQELNEIILLARIVQGGGRGGREVT